MRNVTKKRVVTVGLALTLVASALSGCGSKSSSEPTPTQAPSGDKPVTITVAIPQDSGIPNFKNQWLTAQMEKDCGVEMQFESLPADGDAATQKVTMKINSGTKLPDVICNTLGASTINTYGPKGIFIPVNKYFEDPTIAKNFAKFPKEKQEDLLKNAKAPDGNIYGAFYCVSIPWNEAPYRMWVNKNWLAKSGKAMPTTTDEFYDVLKYFKENDMNGNGKKDEIPMAGTQKGWGTSVVTYIMNAFTYANPGDSYIRYDENGKASPAYTTPEWKAGLEYLAKLVKEGLISPLSFTQDNTQYKAMLSVKGGTVGFAPAASYSTFNAGKDLGFDEMQLVAPLKGPKGEIHVPYTVQFPYVDWVITKDCKNPEKAFEIADWGYSEKNAIRSRYGIDNEDWSSDPEKLKDFTNDYVGNPAFPDAKIEYVILKDQWNVTGQKSHWGTQNPVIHGPELGRKVGTKTKEEAENEKKGIYTKPADFAAKYTEIYSPYYPEKFTPKLTYTIEEMEEYSTLRTQIISYLNESTSAFITGSKSLSEWDAYVKQFEKLGMDRYLSIMEAAYARATK